MTTPPDQAVTTGPGPEPVPRRHAYRFPEGILYATVCPATRDRDREFPVGLIEVTSHPGPDPGAEPVGFVTCRGREYRIAGLYRPITGRPGPDGVVLGWRRDLRAGPGGFVSRGGTPIEPGAARWWRLDALVTATLHRFTADVPGWEAESVRLLLLREWAAAAEAVTRLEALLCDARTEERARYTAVRDSVEPHTTDAAVTE